jgi:hypothetical protein
MVSKLTVAMISCFVCGIVIWSCVEFLIYFKLDEGWDHSDHCSIYNVNYYRMSLGLDSDSGEEFWEFYALFKVKLLIDGEERRGFGCGSRYADMNSATSMNGTYPWQYGVCSDSAQCGGQLLQPFWYCNDCIVCDQFLGEDTECSWFLKTFENSFDDVEDIPPNYDPPVPTEGASFIQVRLRDSVNYDKPGYIVMYVFCVGLMMGIPCLIWLCTCTRWVVNKCRH